MFKDRKSKNKTEITMVYCIVMCVKVCVLFKII